METTIIQAKINTNVMVKVITEDQKGNKKIK